MSDIESGEYRQELTYKLDDFLNKTIREDHPDAPEMTIVSTRLKVLAALVATRLGSEMARCKDVIGNDKHIKKINELSTDMYEEIKQLVVDTYENFEKAVKGGA